MASSANLGKHLEQYVTDLVRTGRYNSRSEVLREGVRLVEEREKHLAVLDASIARALDDVEAGRVSTADDIARRLAVKYRRMAERDAS